MSTRQYIGARYVPILADPFEWDERKQYEHLTIVGFNGFSYISRKNVPANTDINNTEYWVSMGSFSAQIEAERITNEKQWIAINQLLADSFIDYSPSNDFKQKILIIGDSYNDSSRTQYAENGVTVWGEHLKALLGSNAEYEIVGQSGSGWTTMGNYGDTFKDIVTKKHTSEHYYNKIIICGGINDIIKTEGDLSLIPNMIKLTVDYAKSINPDVKIYIGVCGYSMRPTQYKMKELVKTICGVTGVDFHYLNGVEYCMKGKTYLLSDLLHPTNEGEKKIAEAIYQAIHGNKLNYFYKNQYTVKNPSTGSDIMTFTFSIDNENLKMMTFDTSPSFPGFSLNNPGTQRYTELDLGVVNNFEYVVSPNIPLEDLIVCSISSTWRIENAVSSTNVSLGNTECNVALRWGLKTVWDGNTPETHLTLVVAATKIDTNGDLLIIKSGNLVNVGRSPLAMCICNSLVV